MAHDKHFHASADDLARNDVSICEETPVPFSVMRWEEIRNEDGTLHSVTPRRPCYLKFTPKSA